MIISINDSEVLNTVLEKKVLQVGQLYTTDGRSLDPERLDSSQPVIVMESELGRGALVYLKAASVFRELDCCYRLLSRLLVSDGENDDFPSVVMQIAFRLRSIARHSFDLAYAYLAWHTAEDYPVMHHLIVALTLARVGDESAQFNDEDMEAAMAAALTMNISMLELQARLRSQTEPLSRAQRESIRRHPEQAASRLRLLGVTNERWLDIVANHHELPDASGYPRKMAMQDKPTLLLGVCDSFNARIAQREYRDNFTAEEAVKELFAKGDPVMCELTTILLEELGIYPAGSLLQLQGNQIGCSLIRGQSTTTPVVLVFKNSGEGVNQTMLVDSSKREYAVKGSLPRRDAAQSVGLLELLSKIV